MMETFYNVCIYLFMAACLFASMSAAWRQSRDEDRQGQVRKRGIEVEAEILGRYLAGAAQGSPLASSRQVLMTPSDPLELELRYVFDGKEIISRGRVSQATFLRSRGLKTLPVKILPEQPESWAAMV
jgi:hypothetical protein